jgi:hypothetical protein
MFCCPYYRIQIPNGTKVQKDFGYHGVFWGKVVGYTLGVGQGLTVVHFSARPEPCLIHKHTLNTP